MTDNDVAMLPAWQTAHAMDMLDRFRDLGVRMAHGVTGDPEIVLGPLMLPSGGVIYCSMSLHEEGWSYYFDFDDFEMQPLQCAYTWVIPDELAGAIRDVLLLTASPDDQITQGTEPHA